MWPRSGAVGDVPGGVLPSAASECGRVSRDCSLCLGQCSQEPGEWQGGTEGCGDGKCRGQGQNMLLRKRAGQAAVMGGGERSAGQGLEDAPPEILIGRGLGGRLPLTSPSSLYWGSPPLCPHHKSLWMRKHTRSFGLWDSVCWRVRNGAVASGRPQLCP